MMQTKENIPVNFRPVMVSALKSIAFFSVGLNPFLSNTAFSHRSR